MAGPVTIGDPVYGYFRRFLEDGTWARIHDALYVETRDLEGREAQPSAAIIDSQSVKTGPNAKGDVGYDAGKKVRLRFPAVCLTTGLIRSKRGCASGCAISSRR